MAATPLLTAVRCRFIQRPARTVHGSGQAPTGSSASQCFTGVDFATGGPFTYQSSPVLDPSYARFNAAYGQTYDCSDVQEKVTVQAQAGMDYTVWLRLQAEANSKWNDSVWVQFADAFVSGAPAYQIGTTDGLLVNLATDFNATNLNAWGWQNTEYWFAQATTVRFATTGSHTIRVQVREDGVSLDQIVLSPSRYLTSPPGPTGGDGTIVPKP